MWQRFSQRARRVILLAQEESLTLNSGYVGSEHFLLGLIRENEGIAVQVLQKHTPVQSLRTEVEAAIGKRSEQPLVNEPKLTPQAKRALELAAAEARHLKHDYIGTGHLLLGLLREKDTNLATILTKSGLNLEIARQQIQDSSTADIEDSTQGEPVETAHRWEWVLFCGSVLLFIVGFVRLLNGQTSNYSTELSFTLFCAAIVFSSARSLIPDNSWKIACLVINLMLLVAAICFA